MNAFERNSTWKIVYKPKENKTVGCKSIFAIKYKTNKFVDC